MGPLFIGCALSPSIRTSREPILRTIIPHPPSHIPQVLFSNEGFPLRGTGTHGQFWVHLAMSLTRCHGACEEASPRAPPPANVIALTNTLRSTFMNRHPSSSLFAEPSSVADEAGVAGSSHPVARGALIHAHGSPHACSFLFDHIRHAETCVRFIHDVTVLCYSVYEIFRWMLC